MQRASDALVDALHSFGIRAVHGIPGGETVHVMDSILQSGMEFICTRNESPAAFMAMGSSRIHGRPEVCLTTVGPGASNIYLGAGTALLDRVPLLILTGEFESRVRAEPHRQGFDQQAAFSVLCKYSRRIEDPKETASIVLQALQDCMSEPPGPVHLSLPMDVMGLPVDGTLPVTDQPSPSIDADIVPLRDCLLRSQRPLIISGHGTIRCHACDELRHMAEAWNVPVTHSWMGDGVMSWDHPLGLHRIGLPQNHALPAMREADLIICVGLDVEELHPLIWEALSYIPVVHISEREQPVSPRHPSQTYLCTPLRSALERLSQESLPKAPWAQGIKESLHQHLSSPIPEKPGYLHPAQVVRALRQHLGPQDVLVSDVGAHMLWLCDRYPSYEENTFLVSNGMIPMGYGLPAALGVCRTQAGRRVVNVSGDGGFQMSMAELGTAVQHDLPVVSVVWNDSCLGLIRTRHEMAYNRHCGTDNRAPDFAILATAYGANGFSVRDEDGLHQALEEAFRSQRPSVIDVHVDATDNPLLFRPPGPYKS
ncbi:MAG: thiamine pyrophosphate-binding protein [Candidatus Methanomethylophilaceae archaeon]|nr:thiamine pyrophosphate-binding protein [Candidatus Methanomethylophilaceae archaeon]